MANELFLKVCFRLRQRYMFHVACTLRTAFWRVQGMHVGRNVRFSKLEVTWPHRISLGDRCSLEHGTYLNAAGPFGEGVCIDIGEGAFIGTGCEFNITSGLTIGRCSLVAAGTRIIDHNHGTYTYAYIKDQPETSAPVRIGEDVWIGANVVILQGVTIGDGAIVAAGAVVTRSVAPNTIVAGCPARPKRMRSEGQGAAAQQQIDLGTKSSRKVPLRDLPLAARSRDEPLAARSRDEPLAARV